MKFWVYHSRNGYIRLFTGDSAGFAKGRAAQDDENRCTVEEIIEQGYGEVGGSEEEGYFYIDDGGRLDLTEVEE